MKGCCRLFWDDNIWAAGVALPHLRYADCVQVSLTVGSTMAAAADEADMDFWKGAAQPPFPTTCYAPRTSDAS